MTRRLVRRAHGRGPGPATAGGERRIVPMPSAALPRAAHGMPAADRRGLMTGRKWVRPHRRSAAA